MKQTGVYRTILWFARQFLLVASIVTVAVLVYGAISKSIANNTAVVAGVMLVVVIMLSLICVFVDYLRRKFTVDRMVDAILDATDKIATGDFSVRLKSVHSLRNYDQFDYIMDNLNKMAEELSRTEILHSDFVAGVSHEIKTPLAIIQNYAMSLQNSALDEKTRVEYARTLAVAAKRVTALVTNILKLNKLENQHIKPEYEEINLTEALAEAVLGFEDLIETKDIELDCDFDEDIKIVSSASYLEIVWNNLLSNAIKFTEAGGKISVSLKQRDNKVAISISDTGCGMSEETGRHIFEKFYQGDTSHSSEGNGLGLALVKKVIDIIGGEISVESELGKGTTFKVTLGINA